MDAIEAIEGRRDVGKLGNGTGYSNFGSVSPARTVDHKDPLKVLLDLVRKEWGGKQDVRTEGTGEANVVEVPGIYAKPATKAEGWDDRASGEFDGIRSEVDFRRAMALEEARLHGTWSQRALRTLSTLGATLWKSRALRLLR